MKELKVKRFNKFVSLTLLTTMIAASLLWLTNPSLTKAPFYIIAPPVINLGSVKPGDTVEYTNEILIKCSEGINVEKVRIFPYEETNFDLEGKDGVKIPATYICKKASWSKGAQTIRALLTVEVEGVIKWEHAAGKYAGEITIVLSEKP